MEQIKCNKCGQVMTSDNKFCVNCGEQVKTQSDFDRDKFLYYSRSAIAGWFNAFAWICVFAIFIFIFFIFEYPIVALWGILSCLMLCLIFAALSEHFKKLNDISNTLLRIEKRLK